MHTHHEKELENWLKGNRSTFQFMIKEIDSDFEDQLNWFYERYQTFVESVDIIPITKDAFCDYLIEGPDGTPDKLLVSIQKSQLEIAQIKNEMEEGRKWREEAEKLVANAENILAALGHRKLVETVETPENITLSDTTVVKHKRTPEEQAEIDAYIAGMPNIERFIPEDSEDDTSQEDDYSNVTVISDISQKEMNLLADNTPIATVANVHFPEVEQCLDSEESDNKAMPNRLLVNNFFQPAAGQPEGQAFISDLSRK